MRRLSVVPLLVATACFGAAHVLVMEEFRWTIRSWIMEAGKRAGCQVVSLGRVVAGPDGPFFAQAGEERKVAMWNAAYVHSVWIAPAGVGFVAAMAGYGLCAGSLSRVRRRRHPGPTCCGACGYALSGLKEMRCPECGRAV